ncbi:metallophosphoesterase [Devosia sp. MC521]|uniref:metallophosphoesterase n=1 Tax=Devosia sp. MC521 TaxID=2759954 RepID=UPI0015FCC94A|nr:metallophosphoesterase [Devosia sp. MC521]MBJ6989224.1 metallophosphoesterase [Devosia sp. MC521]QMW63344.1 metallophosphoesterase [Devosia sp. MC521]
MLDRIKALFGRPKTEGTKAPRARETLNDTYSVIYAIGDVHGRLDLLKQLEAKILADGDHIGGQKLIVQLGDLIDRGPHSAQTIDHMLSRPARGWHRRAIVGNHEITLCEALHNSRVFERWLGFGGVETLGSYGIGQREIQSALGNSRRVSELLQTVVPPEHIQFLLALPLTPTVENFVFAHAGGRPRIALGAQEERDYLWYTGSRDDIRTDGKTIVHGHEIVALPEIFPGRINVDTGAYKTGILSAVRLEKNVPPRTIQATAT